MSQILRLYGERREFFAELLVQHLRISATAIVIAAAAGLLLGVYISGTGGPRPSSSGSPTSYTRSRRSPCWAF